VTQRTRLGEVLVGVLLDVLHYGNLLVGVLLDVLHYGNQHKRASLAVESVYRVAGAHQQ
jgi:hypothetical protein